ncbi:MAG: glycosyltransferase family 2 protein [Anaerolineae bacterium]|nr:glycosyltransferase family 2 protein [Anaerolineae bacterium]
MDISIIVVSWNVSSLLADCLHTILSETTEVTYQITVVDNASTDGSADMIMRNFPEVNLIRNSENLGFARGNNLGIRALTSLPTYILLLNSDTLVSPGTLTTLVRFMDEHPQAAACSPRLIASDGTPQAFAFGGDPTLGYLLSRGIKRLVLRQFMHDWGVHTAQLVDWVAGTCMLVRRTAMEKVGLLDENIFMYFEDNDWCLRFRKAGWKVYYVPSAEIVHLGGQSLKQNPRAQQAYYQSLRYFYRKHYGFLAQKLLEPLLWLYRMLNRPGL